MRRTVQALCALVALVLPIAVVVGAAEAATRPAVTGLSTHHGPYWGESTITVHGHDFTHVRSVLFGSTAGDHLHVVSGSTLTVQTPVHDYGTVNLRVVTTAGISPKTAADAFTFTHPTMDTPIQGGLTAHQEQRVAAKVRAGHRTPPTAARSSHWTADMGLTAARRAASWLGLPYSWAGGNTRGPTTGVCEHNGGDLDCLVTGFDCSGLSLYAWAPYRTLVHYAQTQYGQAGSFHPAIGSLVPGDLVFFAGYLPDGIGHVAVYAGAGMVIEAAQSGTVVQRVPLADVIDDSGPYRGATRPMSTGRQGALPTVSAVTTYLPTSGGSLTVTGTELGTATSVSVDGATTYRFSTRGAGRLVVRAPAHRAGTAKVVVSTAWGSVTRTVTYVAPPTASKLAPARGPALGGTAVTVSGTGLGSIGQVVLGRTPVAFHHVDATHLTLTMPAHAGGPVPLRLVSRFGTTAPLTFTYVAAGPPTPTGTPTSSAPTSGTPTSTGRQPGGRPTPVPSSGPTSSSAPSDTAAPSTTPASSGATSPSGVPSSSPGSDEVVATPRAPASGPAADSSG